MNASCGVQRSAAGQLRKASCMRKSMREGIVYIQWRYKPNGVGLSVLKKGESIVNVFETKRKRNVSTASTTAGERRCASNESIGSQ